MPTVSKITPQKRKGFYNIFVDGEYSFSLDESALVELKIAKGLEISEQELSDFKKKSADIKLFHKVLHFLEYRPRSVKEVKNYLKYKRKVESEELIEEIVERLKSSNYLDDEHFGRWWIQQRSNQGKGRYYVSRELREKGLERERIERLLREVYPDEREIALKLVKKRLRRYEGLKRYKKWKRLSSYLARRGFSWDVVKEVVNEVLDSD